MRMLIVAALVAALMPAALAGDVAGYRCDNVCPLATEANLHRSYGMEARACSKIARADIATTVERNLARI